LERAIKRRTVCRDETPGRFDGAGVLNGSANGSGDATGVCNDPLAENRAAVRVKIAQT